MVDDIKVTIIWYAAFFILGVIGLPISNYFFGKWKDKGYGISRTIGLVITAVPIWFLASVRLLPFSRLIILGFILFALLAAIYLLKRNKFKINKYIIIQEIVFLVVFLIWIIIRRTNARIEGTEKFMNLAFMNSINRTEYLPPSDPWFSGETINYYYLGHYLFTFVAKGFSIGINYAYNLTLVTIISLTFTSLTSIFINFRIYRNKITNIILPIFGATLICFGGNLHYFVTTISNVVANVPNNYFYPEATRIISHTINEYPAYSIVLGDVHPHYIALPFLVLGIALVFRSIKVNIVSPKKIIFNLSISSFIVLLYGINSWDFLTLNYLFVLVHFIQSYTEKKRWGEKFISFLIAEATLLLPGLLIIIPYLINFSAPVQGIGLVPFNIKSELKPWFLMWGLFLIIFVIFGVTYLKKYLRKLPGKEKLFIVLLLLGGISLVVGVEIFFIRDIFDVSNHQYFRTNTVFKFYYHTWILWGIVSVWMISALVEKFKKNLIIKQLLAILFISVLSAGSLSYMYKAIKDNYFGKYSGRTLDGYDYIKQTYTDDYDAIVWINENIDGQPVILEAVGDAYTYYARISANTGLPTVVGWPTHEWQWRNDSKSPYRRKEDVKYIYEKKDLKIIRELIKKYDIQYIFIGKLENDTYTSINLDLLLEISDIVYSNNDTKLLKVRDL